MSGAKDNKGTTYDSLLQAITELQGGSVSVLEKTPVSGGDINRAYCLSLSNGDQLFVKENDAEKIGFFIKESEGLNALRHAGVISVPQVYGYGKDGTSSFLLMEYIQPGRMQKEFYENFGRKLAALHLSECAIYTGDGNYGFTSDNYIGAGEQENAPEKSWVGFFRKRRLLPQIRRASSYFDKDELRILDRLLEKLDVLLTEPEKPALLHGDLWSGNYLTGRDGEAWLIDPAVYVGHPEADLAMTELFGGFPRAFYEGYCEVYGKLNGYADRRDLYNLYHLLNHLNLFGASYLGAVRRILQKYT